MRYRIFLPALFLLNGLVVFGQKPNWNWAGQIIGNDWSIAYDVTTDKSNNVYSCGFFMDSAQFGENRFYSANQVAYVVKYNAAGEVKWVKIFPSDHSSFAEKIAVDQHDNILLTGYFSGKLTAGNYILNTNSYIDNFFLLKIDTSGTVLWARQSNSSSSNQAASIAIGINDDIYLAGDNNAQTNFGSLVADKIGMFILRYDTNGNPVQIINESGCNSWSVNVAKDNKIYFSGSLVDTAVIAGDTIYPTGYYQYFNIGGELDSIYTFEKDMLFICYNSDGNAEWYKQAKSREYDERTYTVLDENANLYVAGNIIDTTDFWGTALTPTGLSTAFLLKMNSKGNINWYKTGFPVSENGGFYLKNLRTRNNLFYMTGTPYQACTFSGLNIFNTSSTESNVILKTDSAGTGIWAIYDTTNQARNSAVSLAIDQDENIAICGFFEDSVHFGNKYLNSFGNGSPNMFVARVAQKTAGLQSFQVVQDEVLFTLSPNPANDLVTLEILSALKSITIYNSTGQIIREIATDGQKQVNLRLEHPGLYFVRAVSGKRTETKKLIVSE